MGARVIGIAGGADKCRYLVDGETKPSDDFSAVVVKRLIVRGFLVFDYKKTKDAVHALSGWLREGKLKADETVVDGLEDAPLVLNRLFDGSHKGKLVLRVDYSARTSAA
jgi:NADPH-dependent curcumin reductase CurA